MGKEDNKTKKSVVKKEHKMTRDDDNPGSTQQISIYVDRKHNLEIQTSQWDEFFNKDKNT